MMNIKNDKSTPDAPVILNASAEDNYTIDEYDAKAGITLTVYEYLDAGDGDNVKIVWGSARSESYTIFSVEDDFPLNIDILNDWPPECHSDGNYDVYYVATDRFGNLSESSHVPLIIDAGLNPGTLPAPVVPDAAPGYINYNAASDDVEVQITYPDMAEGDSIQLIMKGYDSGSDIEKFVSNYDSYTVTADDVSAGLVDMLNTVTLANMEEIGENAYALFWYTVIPSGSTATQSSVSLRVTVDVIPPGSR
jgi:hypothetical protein